MMQFEVKKFFSQFFSCARIGRQIACVGLSEFVSTVSATLEIENVWNTFRIINEIFRFGNKLAECVAIVCVSDGIIQKDRLFREQLTFCCFRFCYSMIKILFCFLRLFLGVFFL